MVPTSKTFIMELVINIFYGSRLVLGKKVEVLTLRTLWLPDHTKNVINKTSGIAV